MPGVIRLELPHLPTNKPNNLLIHVSIKSAFPPSQYIVQQILSHFAVEIILSHLYH